MAILKWLQAHRDQLLVGLLVTIVGGIVVAVTTGDSPPQVSPSSSQPEAAAAQPSINGSTAPAQDAPTIGQPPPTTTTEPTPTTTEVPPTTNTEPTPATTESTATTIDPDLIRLVPDINELVDDVELLAESIDGIRQEWECSDKGSEPFAEVLKRLDQWGADAEVHLSVVRAIAVPDSVVSQWNEVIDGAKAVAESTEAMRAEFTGGTSFSSSVDTSIQRTRTLREGYGVILEAAGEDLPSLAGTPGVAPGVVNQCLGMAP